jgi:hypothetical protein
MKIAGSIATTDELLGMLDLNKQWCIFSLQIVSVFSVCGLCKVASGVKAISHLDFFCSLWGTLRWLILTGRFFLWFDTNNRFTLVFD